MNPFSSRSAEGSPSVQGTDKNTTRPFVAGLLAAAAILGLSSPAWAHNPVCYCDAVGETQIQCMGGFSDGSDAPGVPIEVISYDEQVLISGVLDGDSTFIFDRPEGEFYVLFDAGPGHTVEIDYTEIQ
ncbi:hypothetical protein [Telmatospirillum sp. J64-1]|uniref:hypothetical protein n=1 Tax=Telmatospirillum sp. J64-1 TaxID=2502183 RepID=UPI001C8F8DD6|nr:hypothetical protein [Telmatospirillum sp. J64-1]